MTKVTIYFPNDPSVGMFPTYFTAEIPISKEELKELDKEHREIIREDFKKLYQYIDAEMNCQIIFEDENI